MANMVNYNGVDLPDINTVWTGVAKETCPYAVILGGEGEYDLVLTTLPIVADDAQQIELLVCMLENGEWGQADIVSMSGAELWGSFSEIFIWSSYDICMSDGTVVFAGAGDTNNNIIESKGDGFALYNGVKLPNIDAVWTDELKAQYPHATLSEGDFSSITPNNIYNILVLANSLLLDPDDNELCIPKGESYIEFLSVKNELDASAFQEVLGVPITPNTWIQIDSETQIENDLYVADCAPLWSSLDLLSMIDNSVHIAASDPIPLDGMNVIEWDGVTDGLEPFGGIETMHMWKVRSALSDAERAGAVCAVTKTTDTYKISVADYLAWNEMSSIIIAGSILDSSFDVVWLHYNSEDDNGLYINGTTTDDGYLYVSLIAYTPASADHEPEPDPGTDPEPEEPEPEEPEPEEPEPEEPEPINPLVAAFWAGFAAGVPG